jgi:hypothetical protein
MPGIFISKGMRVGIPPGGLTISIDKNGQPQSQVQMVVNYDVCPKWIELAICHLVNAKKAREERILIWSKVDEPNKATALEKEFETSMQAIMAVGIALDSFYVSIKDRLKFPGEQTKLWKENRTSRDSQITEVLRLGFPLTQDGVGYLKQNLKEIFRYRNLAVHPSGKLEAPLFHPELNVGVEWRFAYFRYQNAETIVREAFKIIWELINVKKNKNEEVFAYSKSLSDLIAPSVDAWQIQFGPLIPKK